MSGDGGKGLEIDDKTMPIEIDVIIAGDGDFIIGVLSGIQVEGKGGLTDDAGGTAQIVNPDEIIGVSGLLAGALKVGPMTLTFMMVLLYRFSFCSLPGQTGRLWGVREGRALE